MEIEIDCSLVSPGRNKDSHLPKAVSCMQLPMAVRTGALTLVDHLARERLETVHGSVKWMDGDRWGSARCTGELTVRSGGQEEHTIVNATGS